MHKKSRLMPGNFYAFLYCENILSSSVSAAAIELPIAIAILWSLMSCTLITETPLIAAMAEI